MNCCLPIFLLLFSLFSFNARSEVNKWVDENNRVHYSDAPAPINVKSAPIITPAAAAAVPASGESAQKSIAEREADYRKAKKTKEEAEQQAAKQLQHDQAKRKYCEDAHSTLKTLENSPRISIYDAKGEPGYLDDAARLQQIVEVKKWISANCK